MLRTLSILLSLAFIFLTIVVTPAPAAATVTYTYTGNPFTIIDDPTVPLGTYDTTMSVQGFFTTADPLPPNLPSGTDIQGIITAYQFNDGRNTLDDTNSSIEDAMVGTTAGANIDTWFLAFLVEGILDPTPSLGQQNLGIFTVDDPIQGAADAGFIREVVQVLPSPSLAADQGVVVNNPGAWSQSTSGVPEPSTILLIGTGLVGLVGLRRKSRR